MADEDPGGKEQLKKQPKAKQPGPAKKVGDHTPIRYLMIPPKAAVKAAATLGERPR